ncbi:MAG TPA: hypothetical protein VFU22_03960, partial [Roseiflexaceae bacterium]|nr:hypothetical protein [Roseiflexaceae bacterium]
MEPKLFRTAEAAAARRDTATAYRLMRQVLLENPTFVPAWVSMSTLVDDVAQQRECLERALALDSEYKPARERLEQLRLKELLSTVSRFETPEPQLYSRRLGDFLVEEGAITPEQLHQMLAEQAVRKRQGSKVSIGQLLLQAGLVTPEALACALVKQTLAWAPAYRRGIYIDSHTVERLGDYLVVEEVITPAQLEEALVEQLRASLRGERLLLGQILVCNGCLSMSTLEHVLQR